MLDGFVDPQASAQVMLVPASPGVLVVEKRRSVNSAPRAPRLEGAEQLVLADGELRVAAQEAVVVDVDAGYRVRAVSAEPGCQVTGAGHAVPSGSEDDAVQAREIVPNGTAQVFVGDRVFEFHAEDDDSGAPLSPLIAAVDNRSPSRATPPSSLQSSLRGDLEQAYSAFIRDDAEALTQSHGHVFLPQDRPDARVGGLVLIPDWPMLAPREQVETWNELRPPRVPDELLQSAEATSFRQALGELGLSELLRHAAEDATDPQEVVLWPSQLAYMELDTDMTGAIENYLDAYMRLVGRAKEVGDDFGVFWASYPFSAGVWETDRGMPRCNAILLSPLHPVRMAWMHEMERLLWHAASASSLMGVVEGWNLPTLGPSDSGGRMLALPVDNGTEQLFIGWSLLARVSRDGSRPIELPALAGNRRLPGSAGSGLNGGGVAAALRDYRRINPHVSTLTIDIAASNPAPRLDEIDHAIIEEVGRWSGDREEGLPGGVRIYDSLRRHGDIPEIANLGQPHPERRRVPLVWQRYEPSTRLADQKRSDVRVLQDSGAMVEVRETAQEPLGVLAEVPVRRYEVRIPTEEGAEAVSLPGVAQSSSRLAQSVLALETDKEDRVYRVEGTIPHAMLGGSRARWTVAGETFLRPGSLGNLLGDDSGRVLWEWRPPFLDRSGSSDRLLERRPYICIAEIQPGFRRQLDQRLEKLRHDGQLVEGGSDRVLSVLGSRGVGLSSLLALGDQQATGAIGFGLSLELVAHLETDAWQFVIPMDVCTRFLEALAGLEIPGQDRRADLLLLRLYPSGKLKLLPVEIKARGFGEQEGHFPGEQAVALHDPIEQLAASSLLLNDIVERLHEPPTEADRSLLGAGIAALVETAMSLAPVLPAPEPELRNALALVAEARQPVSVGRPLLIYMAVGGSDSDGRWFTSRSGVVPPVAQNEAEGQARLAAMQEVGVHGQLLANAGALAREAWGDRGEIFEAWSQLVEWAFDDAHPDREVEDLGGTAPPAPTFAGSSEPGTSSPTERTDGPGARRDSGQVAGQGVQLAVGEVKNATARMLAEYWPGNTELTQLNMGVVGDLGTGKTQLLKALILGLRREAEEKQPTGISMLVFDYKNDFKDQAFLDRVGGVVVGPTDIPLNIFELSEPYTPQAAYRKGKRFVDVIKKIYSGVGARQEDRLTTAVRQLFEEMGGIEPTIHEVAHRYRELNDGVADSVVALMNDFVMGGIFADRDQDLVPFKDLVADRVIVVDLHGIGADQRTKNSLVAFLLNQYYEYMQGLDKWPVQGADPAIRRLNSFLLVDEAHNILPYGFDALSTILLEGREFGVGTILSSQYLSHFRTRGLDYTEPLLTWFVHRVPTISMRELDGLGGFDATEDDIRRIKTLAQHEAFYVSAPYPGRIIRAFPYWRLVSDGAGPSSPEA